MAQGEVLGPSGPPLGYASVLPWLYKPMLLLLRRLTPCVPKIEVFCIDTIMLARRFPSVGMFGTVFSIITLMGNAVLHEVLSVPVLSFVFLISVGLRQMYCCRHTFMYRRHAV